MRLIINGAVREAPALSTVSELASWLDLPAFGGKTIMPMSVRHKI